ncbi:MAG: tetratricopeptide repeat protein [Elusimicrobiota bacterium]
MKPRTPQYYPLVFSSFWVERRLWGLHPAGYRAVNAALHAGNALLLSEALAVLAVPGGWAAALLFALHPVHAETAAWIAERKNLLSTLFYLLAFLSYWAFRNAAGQRRRRLYAAALGLFLCALWSKTVACTLPVAILLALAWKEDRRPGWQDLRPLLPFFAFGGALGLVTVWYEAHRVGAQGAAWALGPFERLLLAGRIPWFYLGKLAFPHPLSFVYPRWALDPGGLTQWAPPAALAVLFAGLLALRRRAEARAALFALAFFVATLFPALGFFNVYPFRYSFVADHFQYLASAGPLALLAAGLMRLRRPWGGALAAVLAAALLALTFMRSRAYRSLEELWKDTLAKNPAAWIARNNLGKLYLEQDRLGDGMDEFAKAAELFPEGAEIFNNLGVAFIRAGQPQKAVEKLGRALALKPGYSDARFNLGVALDALGLPNDALAQYAAVLKTEPDRGEARYNYALDLLRLGRPGEALPHLREAARTNPIPHSFNNLGAALAMTGDYAGAQECFRQALRLDPKNAEAAANIQRLPKH